MSGLASRPIEEGWSPSRPGSIEALQVVYKIAERCNIDCTYCYYFNMGEETPLERPARASLGVTETLAGWIAQGCAELAIPLVKLSFHGGEPTLVGPRAFGEGCRVLRSAIEPVAALSLSIQTNGTLVDDRWVDAFIDHGVGVGVSIDGPKAANDRFRLDRHGRSTFARTERAVRRLVDAQSRGGPSPATISVVHPGNDYRETYRYLRGLGVRELNFLLPDRNMDDVEFLASGQAASYGSCLYDIFDEWLQEDDPGVRIKFVEQTLVHFRRGIGPGETFHRPRKSNQVIIARSDGTVAVDDSFIPALPWYADAPVYHIARSSLREVLSDPIFLEIEEVTRSLPGGCRDCRWQSACRGGDFENRYSARNGFDNPSVYCEGYKVLYQSVYDALVQNGYPAELAAAKFPVS